MASVFMIAGIDDVAASNHAGIQATLTDPSSNSLGSTAHLNGGVARQHQAGSRAVP
jgi:hypothetical protein